MQKVIKNLGKNLDSMNVYSLFILNISNPFNGIKLIGRKITKKNTANEVVTMFFYLIKSVSGLL